MSKLEIGVGEDFPLQEGRRHGRHRHRHHHHHGRHHDRHPAAHARMLLEALIAYRRGTPEKGDEA